MCCFTRHIISLMKLCFLNAPSRPKERLRGCMMVCLRHQTMRTTTIMTWLMRKKPPGVEVHERGRNARGTSTLHQGNPLCLQENPLLNNEVPAGDHHLLKGRLLLNEEQTRLPQLRRGLDHPLLLLAQEDLGGHEKSLQSRITCTAIATL